MSDANLDAAIERIRERIHGPALKPLAAVMAEAYAPTRGAVFQVLATPMDTVRPQDFVPVPAGATFADLVPDDSGQWSIIVAADDINAYLSRKDWGQQPRGGDVITIHQQAQGGRNGTRNLLQLVVLAAAIYFSAGAGAAYFGGAGSFGASVAGGVIAVGGSALVSAIVPLDMPSNAVAQAQSPNYSTTLQGNTIRMDQAQPVLYGHNESFPDFAAPPYSTNVGNDQFLHVCLQVGLGEYDIPRVSIADTPVQNFANVQFLVIGPGQAIETLAEQTLVATNIVTSDEVAGQDMPSGKWVGPFVATGPEDQATGLEYDIILPRGLDAGRSVSWILHGCLVNEFEQAAGPWTLIDSRTYSTPSAIPVRLSFGVGLATGRYQYRMQRTDTRDTAAAAAHDVAWAGLKSYLLGAGVTNNDATYVVARIRSSEQLSGLSQRRFKVESNRKLPIWNGSTWSAPTVTRNPAWAAVDVLRNTVYGRKLPDAEIDLATYLDLAEVFDARQDRFDFIFDSEMTTWEALQLILGVGRTVPLIRGSRYTAVRDEAQTLPVAMYSMRNIRQGSFALEYALAESDQVDALDYEYRDHRRGDWLIVTAQYHAGVIHVYRGDSNRPVGVPEPTQRVTYRQRGIIGENHAKREAAYRMADTTWRRRRAGFSTELDGLLPAYGSLVAVAHDLPGWGQSGDVWSVSGLTVSTTEPLRFGPGTNYMRLQRPDGSVTDPIVVTAVPGNTRAALLATAPGFTLSVDDADRDRTRYIFGPATARGAHCRVTAITPRSERDIGMSVVLEDDRVHTIDNTWLPVGDEVQDPISDGSIIDDEAGTGLYIVNIADRSITGETLAGVGSTTDDIVASYTVGNDGRTTAAFIGSTGSGSTQPVNEWLQTGGVTPTIAGLYRVRATLLASTSPVLGGPEVFTGTLGSWESLATTRGWVLTYPSPAAGSSASRQILVEIEETATGVMQDSAVITLTTQYPESGG